MIERSFFTRPDVLVVARDLLGTHLITEVDGQRTEARIVETEAYRGTDDRACHAFNNRRTSRTESLFHIGGTAYVYLCYGIHQMFNVVCGPADQAQGVLIRAVEPLSGMDIMLERRSIDRLRPQLTAGPGVLTQALGIHRKKHDGQDLCAVDSPIWLEAAQVAVPSADIHTSPRVGIANSGEAADYPWRFYLANNPWVSRWKP